MNITRMTRRIVTRLHDEAGQALAEYALILTLVAVSLVGALLLLAGGITSSFTDFVDAAGFNGS